MTISHSDNNGVSFSPISDGDIVKDLPRKRKARSDIGVKRGPRGANKTVNTEEEIKVTKDLCCTLFRVITIFLETRNEIWKASEKEIEDIGNALYLVLEKYLPDLKLFGPELTLMMCLIVYVDPRLQMMKITKESLETQPTTS
jgi:hypothetical protein